MSKPHAKKTVRLFNRDIELVGVQIDIVEQLQLGPKTAMQLVAAIGRPEKTVRHSLYVLKHDRNCISPLSFLMEKGKRRQPVWFVSENDPHMQNRIKIEPGPSSADKAREAETRELEMRRLASDESIKTLLKKQHTPFGWLAENAGSAPLPKPRGTQCKH